MKEHGVQEDKGAKSLVRERDRGRVIEQITLLFYE